MLTFKPGVRVVGIRPETALAIAVADGVYRQHGYDCVVTSVVDGKHSTTSLHYAGSAFDLRTRHVPQDTRWQIAEVLRDALGEDFDVILEVSHIHVEFQPRQVTA